MVDFVDIDTLNLDELHRLRDACNRRILEMRQTKGLSLPELLNLLEEVKVTLNDQGKEWYSLERWQWMDGDIRFWLNPTDQFTYRPGWYSIDELIAWAQNRGPVVVEEEDEFEEEEHWPEPRTMQVAWRTDDDKLVSNTDALVRII